MNRILKKILDFRCLCLFRNTGYYTRSFRKNTYWGIFLSNFLWVSSLFAQSTTEYQQALEKADHDTSRCAILLEWGEYEYKERPDSALRLFERLRRLSVSNFKNYPKNTRLHRIFNHYQASALGDMASVYESRGDIPRALDFYFQALTISEETRDFATESGIRNNIAYIYMKQGLLDEALENYQKSLSISQKTGEWMLVAILNNNIGHIFQLQNRFSEALDQFNRVITLLDSLNMPEGKANALNNIGVIQTKLGQYNLAFDNLQKSFELDFKANNKESYGQTYTNFATLFFQKGELEKAEKYAHLGLSVAKELGFPQGIQQASELLHKIYERRGDFSRAYKMLTLSIQMRDSIVNEQNRMVSLIHRFEYQYEQKVAADSIKLREKQMVMESNIAQQKIQRQALIGIILLLLFFGGIMINRFYIIRNQKRLIQHQNLLLAIEKQKSEELLLNILPAETAEELKTQGKASARSYSDVTVMFTDFREFTQAAERMSAEELVEEINQYYSEFDRILSGFDIEKIKTVGDSYMCAGGLPIINKTHPYDVVRAALEFQRAMEYFKAERIRTGRNYFELRIGIHTGPVVAGVVGVKKFAFDIWGDTVNIASRLEASSEVGRVNISGTTYERIKDKFACEYRGKVQAKHKGVIDMYFVLGSTTEENRG